MSSTVSPLVNARKPRAKMSEEKPIDEQKKERKPRTKLTDEQKAIMAAKRKATIAAKKATDDKPKESKVKNTDEKVTDSDTLKKERKVRGKMTDEQKVAMVEKRKATMAKNVTQFVNEPITSVIATSPPRTTKDMTPDAPIKPKRIKKAPVAKVSEMVLDEPNKSAV